MTSSMHPHIYKKGKVLNFKRLSEGTEPTSRRYTFSGTTGSLTSVMNSCNNLNQITGRCLLGIYKLLSYFGLSKDPSIQLSKDHSIYGQFSNFFEGGDKRAATTLGEIQKLLVSQSAKLERLEARINHLDQDRNETPITRIEVLNFTSKLNEIQEYLRKILG